MASYWNGTIQILVYNIFVSVIILLVYLLLTFYWIFKQLFSHDFLQLRNDWMVPLAASVLHCMALLLEAQSYKTLVLALKPSETWTKSISLFLWHFPVVFWCKIPNLSNKHCSTVRAYRFTRGEGALKNMTFYNLIFLEQD